MKYHERFRSLSNAAHAQHSEFGHMEEVFFPVLVSQVKAKEKRPLLAGNVP